MAMSGKLILSLAVVFCVIQVISARPRLDGSFLENVKFDLLRKCNERQRDIEKDVMNLRHKIAKDSMKLMKKASKEGSPECVETARLQAEDQIGEKSEEALDCVRELKESLDTALEPDTELSKIMSFRSQFKNKLNVCKSAAKMEFKSIQNTFSASGKACLV